MIRLHKFSLKTIFFTSISLAIFCAITHKTNASTIKHPQFHSILTTDTVKPVIQTSTKNQNTKSSVADTAQLLNTINSIRGNRDTLTPRNDTVPSTRTDTFSLRLSKDTLDAPVEYEAEDSAVVLVQDKKIILYGKTKTVYRDVNLSAPVVELIVFKS
jgi:hypothetical protein